MDQEDTTSDEKATKVVTEVETVAEAVPEVIATEVSEKEPENEFAYIDDKGFTSEIFKVEIRGLPRYYGVGVS